MTQPYRTTRRVEFRDTDAAGIVHYATFFSWMEEVEHELLRQLGLAVMMPLGDHKISFPRVHASCDYRSALRFEDVVQVEIAVEKLGTSSVTYRFGFQCDGREVGEGKVVAVCCRLDDDQLRSISIPEKIADKLRAAATAQ